MSIELPLFSKMRQVRYHSNEFSERNLILATVVKFCLVKEALVPWEFYEILCLSFLQNNFGFLCNCDTFWLEICKQNTKKVVPYKTVSSRKAPGQGHFCQNLLRKYRSKKLTTVHFVASDGQTSHFMQNLTSYYCFRRPALSNDV